MTEHTCDWVRDRLPEYVEGGLNARDAATVRTHLMACADCGAECELIGLLRTPVGVPAGLEARVVAAVRAHAPVRRPIRQYAVAATFAVAMISGSLLWPRVSRDSATDPGELAVSDEEGESLLSRPGLTALSEEELEALLKEIGS